MEYIINPFYNLQIFNHVIIRIHLRGKVMRQKSKCCNEGVTYDSVDRMKVSYCAIKFSLKLKVDEFVFLSMETYGNIDHFFSEGCRNSWLAMSSSEHN